MDVYGCVEGGGVAVEVMNVDVETPSPILTSESILDMLSLMFEVIPSSILDKIFFNFGWCDLNILKD